MCLQLAPITAQMDHPPEVAPKEDEPMPLIEARLLEGVFSLDEREHLAEGLIDAVVGVKGESFRSETEVLIAEVPVGNWYERGVRIVPEGVGK
jgi:phenylpyruvate tautomerase PptA (4-oxalocrotonate tautomerase family)